MSSRRINWTEEEELQLLQLHKQMGNKWASIAAIMGSKEDSNIKNKFYSTLRKGLRKINNYITNVKKKIDPIKFKTFKAFPELFLTKIILVVDRNYEEKFQVKPRAVELANDIQARIYTVACSETQYLKPQQNEYLLEEKLLSDIQEFNKNCKKRKGKRKQAEGKQIEKQQSNDKESEELEPTISCKKVSIKQDKSHIKQTHLAKQKKNIKEEKTSPSREDNKQSQKEVSISVGGKDSQVKPETNMFELFSSFRDKQKNASLIENNDHSMFQNKAEEFLRLREDVPLTKSSNLSFSLSGSHSFDDGLRRSQNIYQQSPLPSLISSSQDYSSFSFGNLIMRNNFCTQDNNSVDLFASGKIQSKKDQNVMSLVDHLPFFEANSNFLFKSADMIKSTQFMPKITTSRNDTVSGTPFEIKDNHQSLNDFLANINSFTGLGFTDDRIKEYDFGGEPKQPRNE